MTHDSPAMIQSFVQRAVWRWRWRRLESKHSHLMQKEGGYGAFIQPIFKLLNGKDGPEWDCNHKGALRSAVTNRQWPQAKLFQAGMVDSPSCRLGVAAGLCDIMASPEPTVDAPPTEATFEWTKRPTEASAQASGFIDGSRLDAEHDLYGLCARQGWAIAASTPMTSWWPPLMGEHPSGPKVSMPQNCGASSWPHKLSTRCAR